MHPRTQELLDNLAAHRAALRETVADIPVELHRVRPESGRWSVVEVLEHLSILERRLSGAFRRQLDQARAAGLREETETSSVLGRLSFDVLDRDRKLVAPDVVQPTATVDLSTAWQALEQSREGLLAVMADGDGFALDELTFPHPVLGTLTLYQWYEFIAGHEARHTAQIVEIVEQLKGPASI